MLETLSVVFDMYFPAKQPPLAIDILRDRQIEQTMWSSRQALADQVAFNARYNAMISRMDQIAAGWKD